MDLYAPLGFLLISAGITADQATTLYRLKKDTIKVGLERALEAESNPIARDFYRKYGLTWRAFYPIELSIGLIVGLFFFLSYGVVSPPIQNWSVFFLAFYFVGVAINNIIGIFIDIKNFATKLFIYTLILTIITIISYLMLNWIGLSNFDSMITFAMPVAVFCGMIFYRFFSEPLQRFASKIQKPPISFK